MNRDEMLRRLDEAEAFDLIIIGGGATGLGCAIDAAARGYHTLLLEARDFAHGTSSRSTKLVHGGVRYLQQGDIALVTEALHERGLLRRNAPHLVHDLEFVVPNYDWWEAPFYGIGLKVYDLLAGKLGFGRSRRLTREETVERLPTIETEGLRGGVLYYDGQFDDARLAIDLAQTAAEQGAIVLNYFPVTGVVHDDDGLVAGVRARDAESGREYALQGRAVINATGVFADSVRRLDEADAAPMIQVSQGVHIVLERDFLPGDSAIMVPHTDDGRVLFAIPWLDRVVVGTTDTPVDSIDIEPRPQRQEIEFLLRHCARYLTRDPEPEDVLSAFAGLRPLVAAPDAASTAEISRDHRISVSRAGLVTIAGGKWTTYRRMAEETVEQAAIVGGLEQERCVTSDLNIHGYHPNPERFGIHASYGSDAIELQRIVESEPGAADEIAVGCGVRVAEVIFAVREEMARTVDDVLSRRTRLLLLDARASSAAAAPTAAIMARELDRDAAWQRQQVERYQALAETYLIC